MIKLTDFLAFPEPAEAKIKFNMNAGDITKPAWDLLLNDSNDWGSGANSLRVCLLPSC